MGWISGFFVGIAVFFRDFWWLAMCKPTPKRRRSRRSHAPHYNPLPTGKRPDLSKIGDFPKKKHVRTRLKWTSKCRPDSCFHAPTIKKLAEKCCCAHAYGADSGALGSISLYCAMNWSDWRVWWDGFRGFLLGLTCFSRFVVASDV